MTDILMEIFLGQHPGRGSYVPEECRIFGQSLQDQEYKMNPLGRHPFNIITVDIFDPE